MECCATKGVDAYHIMLPVIHERKSEAVTLHGTGKSSVMIDRIEEEVRKEISNEAVFNGL